MNLIILMFGIFTLKEQGSYVQSVTMKYIKSQIPGKIRNYMNHNKINTIPRQFNATNNYDILPEEVEEEYYVWFW